MTRSEDASVLTCGNEGIGERREGHQAEDEAKQNAPHCCLDVFLSGELVLLGEQSQTAFLGGRHSAFYTLQVERTKNWFIILVRANREGAPPPPKKKKKKKMGASVISLCPCFVIWKSLEGQRALRIRRGNQTYRCRVLPAPRRGNPCCCCCCLFCAHHLRRCCCSSNLAITTKMPLWLHCTLHRADWQKMSTFGQFQLRAPMPTGL